MLDAAANPTSWVDLVQSGGVIGTLLFFILAAIRRWVVMGWTYDAMERDRNYYRDLALKGAELADRQTALAEVLTERLTAKRFQTQADGRGANEQ